MPTIAPHSLRVFLLQLAFLLLFAPVLGRLAERFRMPAVVGELCAGMLLGPSVLQHVLPGFSDWLLPQQPEQMHMLDATGQLRRAAPRRSHRRRAELRARPQARGDRRPGQHRRSGAAARPRRRHRLRAERHPAAGRRRRHRLRVLPRRGDVRHRDPGDRQDPPRHEAAAPATSAS
ncbi:hypothetical protein LT493_08400 [Streptomyces tricolor]|nr:hypothetical protein [Streptomyces tricolor]